MPNLQVDCDFPSGNILIDSVQDDLIELHPDLRDTGEEWFYWCFRVRAEPGTRFTMQFTGHNVIGVRGPAVSLDLGMTWKWMGRECVEGKSFTYQMPARAQDGLNEVRFSMGMPYVQAHLDRFLEQWEWRLRKPPYSSLENLMRKEELCRSRKGRSVEVLYLGDPVSARHRLILTCRHHACEMMASYALEGILAAALEEDEVGQWFRANVAMLVVPFMDKDGVEDGDQGKSRIPHDHNRDYGGEDPEHSIYPETRALRELASRWGDGRVDFFLDLHCPWIRGQYNEDIYFVHSSATEFTEEVERFSQVLEETRTGPLPYRRENNLPVGKAWNTGITSGLADNCKLQTSAGWARTLPGIRFASSIEIPYANAGGAEVNADSARLFGRDLARAIMVYFGGKT